MKIGFLNLPSINHPSLCKGLEVNLSPVSDAKFLGKSYHYEVGTLSYVLALLCKMSEKEHFASLDEGFLSAESCFGEEEASELLNTLKKADEIIVEASIKEDKNYKSLAYFLHFLKDKFKLKLSCTDEGEIKNYDGFKLLPLDEYNGLLVMKAKFMDESLHCSAQFLQIARLKDEDECLVSTKNAEFRTKISMSADFKGTVGFCKLANENFEKIRAIKCL